MMLNKLYYILGILLLVSCIRKADSYDVLFPENYDGWAALVFDCDGTSKFMKNADGRIQLTIPETGILMCDFPRPKGALDYRVYKIQNGQKKEVQDQAKQKLIDSTNYYLRGNILLTHQPDSENLSIKREIIFVNVSTPKSNNINSSFEEYSSEVIKHLEKECK